MFVLDDILLFPVNSLLFVFRQLYNAVQQESLNEADDLRAQLSELYMMLETQKITEEEFGAQEKEILDRLDKIQSRDASASGEGETHQT